MEEKTNDGGLGFFDILSLILITLKLLGEISCGWIVAFLPWALKYIFGYGFLILGWIIEIWKTKRN